MTHDPSTIRTLIACEESGIVRDAFLARGFDAYSCDILPRSHPRHITGDVLDHLGDGWDCMIAHPECTFLTVANTYMKRGCSKYTPEKALEYRKAAIDFFMAMAEAPVDRIAVENPIGIMSRLYRKPDQIIQPWMFGEDASKSTCLWLKGLPPLYPTKIVPPAGWKCVRFAAEMPVCDCCGEEAWCEEHQQHFADCECLGPTMDEATYKTINGVMFGTILQPAPRPVWSNQTPSGQNKLGPSQDRARLRSMTYPGIARSMAQQWGDYLMGAG